MSPLYDTSLSLRSVIIVVYNIRSVSFSFSQQRETSTFGQLAAPSQTSCAYKLTRVNITYTARDTQEPLTKSAGRLYKSARVK